MSARRGRTTPARSDPERDRKHQRIDAFVEHVRLLSPEDWGRLDASADRHFRGSLWARLRKLRLQVDLVLGPVGMLVREIGPELPGVVASVLRGDDESARSYAARETPAMLFDEEMPLPKGRYPFPILTLHNLAQRQPLGPGRAWECLFFALVALEMRDSFTPEVFARLYAPMEPVIPLASLDEGPRLVLPAPAAESA